VNVVEVMSYVAYRRSVAYLPLYFSFKCLTRPAYLCFVSDEVDLRLGRLGRRGSRDINLRLVFWFLDEDVDERLLLVGRRQLNRWRCGRRWRRRLDENYLVMLLRRRQWRRTSAKTKIKLSSIGSQPQALSHKADILFNPFHSSTLDNLRVETKGIQRYRCSLIDPNRVHSYGYAANLKIGILIPFDISLGTCQWWYEGIEQVTVENELPLRKVHQKPKRCR